VDRRRAEVEDLLALVSRLARERPDIRGLALVGSWARGDPGPESDVDLVLLTDQPEAYLSRSDWLGDLGGREIGARRWGAITERRLVLPSGLEVDVGIGRVSWASLDPIDPGTRAVVEQGFRALHDPEGILEALAAACPRSP
jgi:predicted nucleotidyltransferase